MKKVVENKNLEESLTTKGTKEHEGDQVTLIIKPGRGIGGIGGAGTKFSCSAEEAEQWIRDGYAEPWKPEVVESDAADQDGDEEKPIFPAESKRK